jgi:hypothetical protein
MKSDQRGIVPNRIAACVHQKVSLVPLTNFKEPTLYVVGTN